MPGEITPLAVKGLQEFNMGKLLPTAHLFEEQWVNTSGPVRDLYRAVLQVGVAYYQIENGNYLGAIKMLQRSVQWLHIMPNSCQGIDVEQTAPRFLRGTRRTGTLGSRALREFDKSLLKPVRWKAH